MVQGVEEGVDGVMFVGYHGREGSTPAILDHTWSRDLVSELWINDREFGEAGLNGAVCGHFGVPVIMASGDQTLCAAVREIFGEKIETAEVKRAVSRTSAECLPSAVTARLIEEAAKRAVLNLKNKNAPNAFKPPGPFKMALQFMQSDMADRAALMPHAQRGADRRVEYEADDMITIYLAFRTMLALGS